VEIELFVALGIVLGGLFALLGDVLVLGWFPVFAIFVSVLVRGFAFALAKETARLEVFVRELPNASGRAAAMTMSAAGATVLTAASRIGVPFRMEIELVMTLGIVLGWLLALLGDVLVLGRLAVFAIFVGVLVGGFALALAEKPTSLEIVLEQLSDTRRRTSTVAVATAGAPILAATASIGVPFRVEVELFMALGIVLGWLLALLGDILVLGWLAVFAILVHEFVGSFALAFSKETASLDELRVMFTRNQSAFSTILVSDRNGCDRDEEESKGDIRGRETHVQLAYG